MMDYELRAWNMKFVLFYVIKRNIIILFLIWKTDGSFVYIIFYCVGAGISTL